VLREASPGAYYLDEEVWRAVGRTRTRLALVLGVLAILIAMLVVLGVFGGPRT
jgi:hypothetical protein